MSDSILERQRQHRREEFLLAAQNPWLLWRLQAYRAGYIPPLRIGEIPPELARVTIQTQREEYDVRPLVQHARQVRSKQRSFVRRALVLLLVGMSVLVALGISSGVQKNSNFRIEFLEEMISATQESPPIPAGRG
jgi:hypothetical protein